MNGASDLVSLADQSNANREAEDTLADPLCQDGCRGSDDFDWDDVADHIVQQQVELVAIFQNRNGDVVVRQQRRWDEQEDVWVILARAHAVAAARAILRAAGFPDIDFELAARITARTDLDWDLIREDVDAMVERGVLDDTPAKRDRTGADRQRRYRQRKGDAERDGVTPSLPLRVVTRHQQEEQFQAAS